MKYHALFFIILFPLSLSANINESWSLVKKHRRSLRYYPILIKKLVDQGLYYASIPYIKEYLTIGGAKHTKNIDSIIDRVVTKVGVRQFEVLPTRFLQHSHAPMLRYILAKKNFRRKQYERALAILRRGIGIHHPAKPFALHLEGAILSIKRQYLLAKNKFQQCVYLSNSFEKKMSHQKRKRQLKINRDSCLAGIARNYFNERKFNQANSAYLDIEKSSPIWPEILFEEAWSSFYRGNYNRTLGKLVTYKAPIFDYIHNPEIDILRALTYMELCLWEDTNKVVNDFYKKYEQDTKNLARLIKRNRNKLKEYYLIVKNRSNLGKRNDLLSSLISSLKKDASYQELYQSFVEGQKEIEKISRVRSSALRRELMSNVRDSMNLQRNLIGGYVKKTFLKTVVSIKKMFQGMSYIKLEVLAKAKSRLYNETIEMPGSRSRGARKYLKRSDKQYFWTFNGEFWADELGDYVFALKSAC